MTTLSYRIGMVSGCVAIILILGGYLWTRLHKKLPFSDGPNDYRPRMLMSIFLGAICNIMVAMMSLK